jgi:hypothetical protein
LDNTWDIFHVDDLNDTIHLGFNFGINQEIEWLLFIG